MNDTGIQALMMAGIQDLLCGKRLAHGIAAQDLGLIKIINFLDRCPLGELRNRSCAGTVDQLFHGGRAQAQLDDILSPSDVHIDDLLVEVRTGGDDAGNVQNDGIPSFGNIKKRFQALDIRKISFYDFCFLWHKYSGRVIGQNENPHFFSLINQLTAYGAAQKTGCPGHHIQRVLICFCCHNEISFLK